MPWLSEVCKSLNFLDVQRATESSYNFERVAGRLVDLDGVKACEQFMHDATEAVSKRNEIGVTQLITRAKMERAPRTKTLKTTRKKPPPPQPKNYNNLVMEDENFGNNTGTITGGGSIFLHAGFFEILKATGSRFLSNSPQVPSAFQETFSTPVKKNGVVPTDYTPQSPRDTDAGLLGITNRIDAMNIGANKKREPLVSRKVNIGMIGRPGEFRHVLHASDADQAEQFLTRWKKDGQGKLPEPQWVQPIKEAARARARAKAVAEVQNQLEKEIPKGSLKIINGVAEPLTVDSSILSDVAIENGEGLEKKENEGYKPIPPPEAFGVNKAKPKNNKGLGVLLEHEEDHMENGEGEKTVQELLQEQGGGGLLVESDHHKGYATGRLEELQKALLEGALDHLPGMSPTNSPTQLSPIGSPQNLNNFFQDNEATVRQKLPSRPPIPDSLQPVFQLSPSDPSNKQRNFNNPPPATISVGANSYIRQGKGKGSGILSDEELDQLQEFYRQANFQNFGSYKPQSIKLKNSSKFVKRELPPVEEPETIDRTQLDYPDSPRTVIDHGSSIPSSPHSNYSESPLSSSPKPFVPSLTTVEKSVATKVYLENHYYAILKRPTDRAQRKEMLEEELVRLNLSDTEKENVRAAWALSETEHLRDMRSRVGVKNFQTLKVIGHGAFGVVTLVKEKGTGELYAMKQLRKGDMLRKGQEGHVRAERDLMKAASTTSRWIVRLNYSFQDVDHLYLVMEYMGGGDLLNLLIERDTFPEDFARFYVAEMVLAIEEAHKLGYIHRDIKPDNFLFDKRGHIKISDFGLATDFHWAHDGAYYDYQRRNLLKKHGIDLEEGLSNESRTMKLSGRDMYNSHIPGDGGSVLTWREKNRRKLAFSLVGTQNYFAVEVLRGTGYDQSCDWWSLGVILYEMLFGFPPFVSKSRHVTRQKILNWRQALNFPPKTKISREARDLIERLICEREDRLGSKGINHSSKPNSVVINTRLSGFINAGGGPPPGIFDRALKDGAYEIKSHPWFRGIDFSTIHLQVPPFIPELQDPTDTRYFEDDIDANPLPAPDGGNPDATKDPMLGDKVHGKHLLEVRKQLAFHGFTYKRPKRQVYDPRQGILDLEKIHEPPTSNAEETRGRKRASMVGSNTGGSKGRSLSL